MFDPSLGNSGWIWGRASVWLHPRQDDDEEIDVDDYSSEQRMLTTRPEGMPEKSKLTFKVCEQKSIKIEDYVYRLRLANW